MINFHRTIEKWKILADHFSHAINFLILALIFCYSTWFISSGYFPSFPQVRNLYIDLSQAFLHGQVSLLDLPDPGLAQLKDTHDAMESHLPFLWDASYYQGKYYIYWGPVPALVFILYAVIQKEPAPGQFGILSGFIGIAIVLTFFFYHFRARFFPKAPLLTIGLFLITACVNIPNLFLLARPLVYETSIIIGQFFLLLGLLFTLLFIKREKQWLLVFCGVSWGLSVLSRYNLIISVFIYVIFLFFYLVNKKGLKLRSIQVMKPLALLIAPLVVFALLAGWYNYIRFHDPLQMGITYQLTDPVKGQGYYSPQYINSNLYVYFFFPTPLFGHFPFVNFQKVSDVGLPGWAHSVPGKRFDEVFFGTFRSIPIIWGVLTCFSILGILGIARRHKRVLDGNNDFFRIHWFLLMLLISSVFQSIFLLFYYYSASRFLSDFFLPLILAGMIGFWQLDSYLLDKKLLRLFYWTVIFFASAQTVIMGFFSGFNIPYYFFVAQNPALYDVLKLNSRAVKDPINIILNPLIFIKRIIRFVLLLANRLF